MAILAAATAHGQNINVTAANASNDAIYTVNFANQTINVQNTDGGSLHSIRSLAFVSNLTNLQLDLLAADNAGGLIVRYCADFNTTANPPGLTTGTVVWNETEGGPTSPDGLSVDSAGNLFLVNQGSGTSSSPQLWVLQGLSSCVKKPPAPTSVQIDANYGAKETLEETLIAGTTIPLPAGQVCLPSGACLSQINPGDLLVLTSNPAFVLIYPGSNGSGPTQPESPATLINLPVGTSPGGMAFWPADNSLLVTTGTGSILEYNLTTLTQGPNFASNLGNGQFKVKTGIQGGNPFAFIADNNGGRLLEFSGPNQLMATVTNGVQHPQGLAVTNIAYQPFANCAKGCNVLGGNGAQPLLAHQVTAPKVPGNIIENVCVVRTDPRVAQYGSCTAAASAPNSPYANGLRVSQVCGAGFDNPFNPLVISNSMCGGSGGSGFALVKTLTQAYSTAGFPLNGNYVENDSEFSALPPGPNDPVCALPPANVPFAVLGWAPLEGEGKNPGGSFLTDVSNGCDQRGGTGIASLWAVGLALNTGVFANGLPDVATANYGTLLGTLQSESGEGVFQQPSLQPPSLPDGNGNFTQVQECINTSQLALNANNVYAALELLVVDQYLVNNASQASIFTPNSDYPNPSGMLRQLVENQYFTIDERINNGSPFGISVSPPVSPLPQPAYPPTIAGTPQTHVTAGTAYSFQPTFAQFFGGNPLPSTLTFTIVNKPSWALFNASTGALTGTAVKGTYPGIVISVTDGCASASLPAFNIKVTG